MKTKLQSSLATGAVVFLALSGISQSRAQTTSTWITETRSSGGTANWSVGSNWGGTAPAPGNVSVDFTGLSATTSALTLTNDIAGTFNVYQMKLANAATTVTYNKSASTTMNWVKSGTSNPELILNGASGGESQISFASGIGSGVTLQITGVANATTRQLSVMSGAGGVNVNKTGTGNLYLAAANTYTGDFTLTSGVIGLMTDSVGTPNNVTSGPLGRGTVHLNGGTVTAVSAVRTVNNSVQVGGDFTVSQGAGAANNITFAGTVMLTGAGVTRTITGDYNAYVSGTRGTLAFTGAISEAGAGNGITFANTASTHIVLSGINTYTGSTTVTGGNMTLSDNAGLKFVIGANGINNQLTGTGIINLDGDFTFDLTGAGTALGNSWNIVNSSTEAYGSTFSVVDFYSVSSTLWAQSIGGGKFYNFDETTGLLSVTTVPEPATWVLLALGLTVTTILRRRRMH